MLDTLKKYLLEIDCHFNFRSCRSESATAMNKRQKRGKIFRHKNIIFFFFVWPIAFSHGGAVLCFMMFYVEREEKQKNQSKSHYHSKSKWEKTRAFNFQIVPIKCISHAKLCDPQWYLPQALTSISFLFHNPIPHPSLHIIKYQSLDELSRGETLRILWWEKNVQLHKPEINQCALLNDVKPAAPHKHTHDEGWEMNYVL
jgi:hypothetical protein